MKPHHVLIAAACFAALSVVLFLERRDWPHACLAVAVTLALVACSGIL